MPWIVGAMAVLAVGVVVVLVWQRRKPKNYAGADVYRSLMGGAVGQTNTSGDPKLEGLRQNLRVKLLYQEDKVDAAIAFERERNPTATMEESMKAAIARWERDNQ